MEINKRSGNFGISVGLAFSVVLLFIHAIVDWLNSGVSQGDAILWLFQIVIYFIASLIAANAQFHSQSNSDNPLSGVLEAGRGSAMIACAVMWGYVVVRSLVLDDPGMFGGSGLFPLCGFILLDFIVAFALGSWGGRIIVKQHEYVDPNS